MKKKKTQTNKSKAHYCYTSIENVTRYSIINFCVTLTNLVVNLGGEAILRVGNLGVLLNSRVKVQTQLTPNSTVGGDAEVHLLLPSLSYPMQKPYRWVCMHVQCSIKFQNWTFMVCIMARHIRMLLC